MWETGPPNVIEVFDLAVAINIVGDDDHGDDRQPRNSRLVAGEPLTVPQIAERMPKTGLLSAAMRKYREHKEKTDPDWLIGKGARWDHTDETEAMVWWVQKIVRRGCQSKILTNTSGNPKNPHVEGVYAPNLDNPPKVRRMVWVQQPRLVNWTLEDDRELNAGHGAGIEFMSGIDEFIELPKHPWQETKAILELAKRAISAKHQ